MKQQAELFPRDWNREFFDTMLKRIPKKAICSVSEAGSAMNKSPSTVRELCEIGELAYMNTSTGDRPAYDVLTASIVDFYRRRLGITDDKQHGTPISGLARK